MPAILALSNFEIQRARDGENFGHLAVLSFATDAFINPLAGASCHPGTMGPGATADVPGTHFYWSTSSPAGGTVKRCNGDVPTAVAGGPARDQNYQLLYDAANDRMYVAYFEGVANNFRVASFDFAEVWDTSIANTEALATGSGCIALIPVGAVNAGLLLAGWCNDGRAVGTRCVVQRWDPDAVAWVDELFTPSASSAPKTFGTWGAQVVFGLTCQLSSVASEEFPLVELRDAAGAWTNITPEEWNIPLARQAAAVCPYGDDLYVAFQRDDFATRVEIWKRTAAGVWSMDLDLIAEGSGLDSYVASLTVIDGVLLCGLDVGSLGYYLAKPGVAAPWERRPVAESQVFPGTPGDASFFVQSTEGTIDPPSGNCSGEHGAVVRIAGFWDAQAFVAWAGDTVWTQSAGLWLSTSSSSVGTQVFMGNGVAFAVGHGNLGALWTVGEIDVVDTFVLRGAPTNGKGFVNVQVDNSRAPGHGLLGDANFPLFLEDGYEFVCPAISTVDPPSADLDGGAVVTLHGTHFFSNQITPSQLANYARVVNRIFVRSGAGTAADPHRVIEVPYALVTFVDTETLTFPLPPYPGGADPNVEILLSPAGLAPFNFGVPVGIAPTYKCDRVVADFAYTGVEFAILGSLETLLGLGGTGGDVIVPGGGGGGGGGTVRCPAAVVPGPCDRS